MELLSFKMTEDQSNNSPWSGLDILQQTYAKWERNSIMERITQDHLFSATYLQAVHYNCPFKSELIT